MDWWPQEDWARMVAGVDCPMCADANQLHNAHGDLLAELPGSYARLSSNQTHAGYSVVILKRHATELPDLAPEELCCFWSDVAAVAGAVAARLSPVKIDYLVMGHLCPHLHCHVIPQYRHDDPHAPINPQDGGVRLSSVSIEPTVDGPGDELRHYVGITAARGEWVAGNGAHVAAVAGCGADEFVDQFRTWEPKPDPPIWTPRLLATITPTRSPRLAIATARRDTGSGTEHAFLHVDAAPAGSGVRATTYRGPVGEPRADGRPRWVRTDTDVEDVAHTLWEALPCERRVLLVAGDLEAGTVVCLERPRGNA